jgi:hypothetical protein
LYHFVPPQSGAIVARGQFNRGIAALLATTALVASPAVLLPGFAMIALVVSSVPAAADGGRGWNFAADGGTRFPEGDGNYTIDQTNFAGKDSVRGPE